VNASNPFAGGNVEPSGGEDGAINTQENRPNPEPAESARLGALFGSAGSTEDSTGALGSLFTTGANPVADTPATRAEPAVTPGLDLASIFTPVGPPEAPATASAPSIGHTVGSAAGSESEPVIRPRARKKPVPAALASALSVPVNPPAEVTVRTASSDPQTWTPAPASLGLDPAAPAPAPVVTNLDPNHDRTVAGPPETPVREPVASGPPPILVGHQPVAEAPSSNPTPAPEVPAFTSTPAYTRPDTSVEDAQRQAKHGRRAAEIERSWPVVDRILSALQSDVALQNLVDRLELSGDLAFDTQQRAEFIAAMRPRLSSVGVSISSPSDVDIFLSRAYDEILNISVLGDVWRDPEITEIMVDRWDVITVERNGRLEQTAYRFRDPNHANSVARKLAAKISDRAVSQSIPLVTAELPRARVTIAFGAVVKGGLSIVIRKFRDLLGLDDLLRLGALNDEMVAFLRDAVQARVSVVVSGGTGTGKTTMINMLSSFIPDSERVITIEDAFELQLANTHVVSLQTKEASSRDDTVHVTLADLLRNTLRMRPDRIIVGEIREAEGAMVVIAAAGTGHEGTITTIHANSADDAVNERLTDLMAQARKASDTAVRRSITSAFDLVVQVTRGRNGRRFISEIANLTRVGPDGVIEIEPIFIGEEIDNEVRFSRVPVRANTGLGRRLIERGGQRWVTN
jgi:pilus assembly protein CpaF